MATLEIVNHWSATILNGGEFTGKQGALADAFDEAYAITVSGPSHIVPGTLATGYSITVWDGDINFPASFDYLWYWADQNSYIQLITGATGGAGTNVILKCIAKVPIALGADDMLAAANTTLLSGVAGSGTEPSVVAMDSVAIGNYSGNSMNFLFALFD